jgi:hypothetical protein
MKIIEIDPEDPYRKQQFLDLPQKIYQDTPPWVPPFEMDTQLIFDKQRNPFYKHSQATFLLAVSADGASVGRLAVLHNRRYNEYNHEQTGFFYLFECMQNEEASSGLFEAGFEWARQQRLNRLVGPRGFSSLDGLGMLVKGFEHRPAFGIPYNLAYCPQLVESAGFLTQSDIVSGYLSTKAEFPEKIHRVSQLVQQRRGLTIARFKTRRDLRQLVKRMKELYNGMIEGTSGNVPLTDEEVAIIGDQILWLADPKLIKVIMKGETPVGFLFAYPDISAALQRTHGRVFPLGWITLLLEMRRTKWVNINGMGILPEYQGLGGTAILFSEMKKSIDAGRFTHADIVQIGVDNEKMQRELNELGIDFYKVHRVYVKELDRVASHPVI